MKSAKYILQGLGIGAMPTQIICTEELREGAIVPILPDWAVEPLAVHLPDHHREHRQGADLECVRFER
jgi:hypothetical protein